MSASVELKLDFVELGIMAPDADDRFTPGRSAARRASPRAGRGRAVPRSTAWAPRSASGQVSLDFLDAPAFERFSALERRSPSPRWPSGPACRSSCCCSSARRPAPPRRCPTIGSATRSSRTSTLLETAIEAGFRPAAIQQLIRAQGDSLRRMAETEAAMWQSEVIEPATAAGKRPDEILGVDFGDRMSALTEQAVIAMYHLQQARAWTGNIIEGLETQLAAAGLHSRLEHPPAMCFLDITGYTRLTQEQGDAAAAELAEQLGRIVQRTSVRHGGRAVKWLGDGVMLHFPNPGAGVVAALEMVEGVAEAGLPPAHVGLHAGRSSSRRATTTARRSTSRRGSPTTRGPAR